PGSAPDPDPDPDSASVVTTVPEVADADSTSTAWDEPDAAPAARKASFPKRPPLSPEIAQIPAPKAEELNAGPTVSPAREMSDQWIARALRGWLAIECRYKGASISLVGGSRNGVVFDNDGEVVRVRMPLAPGDRRVFQIASVKSDYGTESLGLDAIISE